jgi:hypothetical protein
LCKKLPTATTLSLGLFLRKDSEMEDNGAKASHGTALSGCVRFTT